jgi:hypothetical protein
MNIIKPNLYVSIPLLCALIGGFYEWYFKCFLESHNSSDNFEISKWAFVAGIAYSIFGFWIGVIIDLILWLITTSYKKIK